MTGSFAGRIAATPTVLLLLVGCQSTSVMSAHQASGYSQLSAAERSQLSALEARPLAIPQMPASGSCPAGPQTHASPFGAQSATYLAGTGGSLYGAGPVYFLGGPDTSGTSNTYFDVTIFTDPTVKGVVVIRGQQLGGKWRVVAVGAWAAGASVGVDSIDGQQVAVYSEVVLPADHPRTKASMAPGWSYWEPRIGIDKSDTGPSFCVGFQIDTLSGSEVFVVE